VSCVGYLFWSGSMRPPRKSRKLSKVRKRHKCKNCGVPIQKGRLCNACAWEANRL